MDTRLKAVLSIGIWAFGSISVSVAALAPVPAAASSAWLDRFNAWRAAANLPIEGYDNLTVPQIVAHLVSLNAAELRQLRTYEKRHKNRAGVLSRIEGALKAR